MIKFSQIQRYKFSDSEKQLSNVRFLDLMNVHHFVEPSAFSKSSYGWDASFESKIVSTQMSSDFVVGVFLGCKREAPKELVSRHVQQDMRTKKSQGVTPTKQEVADLALSFSDELDLKTPPLEFKGATFYIEETQELWILTEKKSDLDEITSGLLHILRESDLEFKLCKFDVSDSIVREVLLEGIESIDVKISTCKFKYQNRTVTIYEGIDEDFRGNVLGSGSKFINATFGSEQSDIEMTVARNGHIHSIAALDGFRASWYENGDPESPDFLRSICTALWVQQVQIMCRTISQTCLAYNSNVSALLETA